MTDADTDARALTGGCACGDIRYRAEGTPFDATICHCSLCRRTTGAPSVAWFSVMRDAFTWTAGSPTAFHSSSHGTRRFCGRCGTQLTFESDRAAGEIDITTCSLDDAALVPPADHTHVASKPAWEALGDGLPAHGAERQAGGAAAG